MFASDLMQESHKFSQSSPGGERVANKRAYKDERGTVTR